jgi:hypothetical protein
MASWDTTATQKYIGKYYELSEKPAQFAMLANTSKWFMPRKVQKKGKRYNFWAYTEPMTSVRRATYANARDNAFPTPQSDGVTILSYDTQDLTVFQNTIELNELLLQESQDALSIENLAERAIMAQNRDYAFQMNNAIWQPTDCQMALVNGTAYKDDWSGDPYASGDYAYVKIDNGAISQFTPGMTIDFDTGGTDVNGVTVKDVFYGSEGPYKSDGTNNIAGPGIVIYKDSAAFTNIADNSVIRRSGEGASGNFKAFPAWFDPNTNVYNDEDGSEINRDGVGNAWSIPNIFNYTSGGSAVVFDIAAHFTDMSNVLANRIHTGRASRDMNISRDEGVSLPGVLTAFGRPNLINEAVSTLDDSRRFTMQAAASLDEEQRKSYFGAVSFDGVVYHDPNLGAIALQADPASTANQLLVLDPQSWFYLTDSNNMKPTWVDDGAGKWTRMVNTNITMKRQAGTYLSCLLVCDQMPANSIIKGITSTATAV